MAIETTPEVERIMRRYEKAKQHKQPFVPVWTELDEFYRGDQYKNSKIPPWVPKPVTNFIHLVVTTKRAALAAENPSAMLAALSPQDLTTVEKLQKVYEWTWKKVKARKVMRENIETSKLMGTGIAHMYWDEYTGVKGGTGTLYEGEIRTKQIDLMNFFPDPDAYRVEDCKFIHVTDKVSRKQLEKQYGISLKEVESKSENYGENYNRDYYKGSDAKDDGMIDLHAHYEKYWNTEKMTEQRPIKQFNPLSGEQEETGEMEDVETDEEIGGWNYKVTYVAGNKQLEVIDPLEPNMYPFAVLYDFPQRQSFWGKGTAELIIENQKLINKVESIIAMIGTLLQNPQKIITKRSGINPIEAMKYSFAPGHVWVTNEGDPANSIKWQEVPQIPQALVNLAEMAKENIREITGMNEAYMGQSVGSLQTSGGVNTLVDRATMRDKDQMFDLELYVEDMTRLLLGFVTTKYTEERYVRFVEDPANPQATQQFLEFVGADFASLDYDLEIDVSAKAPITQARREAELTDLIQLQGQYQYAPAILTPQEYVKGKRMVDAPTIIARMNREEQQNKMQILTKVAGFMHEAMSNDVPPEEILQMSANMIQGLEAGTIPLDGTDPNAPAMGGGVGNAADNMGGTQAQQMSM